MEQKFYSNGKLLLSGEYAVLDGAKAWAVPTKFGQHLNILQNNSGSLTWKSIDHSGLSWFEGTYHIETLTEISSSDTGISKTLINILSEAKKMNSAFLEDFSGLQIETRLTFSKNWGLGSSSTLINNIAQWANVDAYQLLWNAFSGSGYDIACAQINTPIIYQLQNGLPSVLEINTKPGFSDFLFFVYLNKKRNSREAIKRFRERTLDKSTLVAKISELTLEMVSCSRIDTFERLLEKHETILSEALGTPTIKQELFDDYTGSIKSLGAWGGDFILVTGDEKNMSYFRKKGYETILAFQQMIL